uniref:EB domain-containing protein n=1 Tax=Rhabditophanes sp. KR3021 TaxID=114890 RepID=A0AC35TR92_9BILA
MRIIKQSTNTVFILLFVIVSAAGLLVEENQPCNTERDILLATDPSQNTQTYLKCVPANIGSIGFWNKLFCAPATKFDFVTQSCIQDLSTNGLGGTFNFNAFKSYTNTQAYKTPPQTKEQLPLVEPPLKIAILNNSCVNGETCIGNSICDISAGVCKCPYGHTADLSTLSCNEDKPDGGPMVVSTVQQEDGSFKFTFRSQGPYSFNQQLSDLTMAKPTYKKVDNPEKIEFVGAKYPAEMPTIKPFAVLKALFAKPGEACTDGKICGGGSYCMAPAMLCLCPGTLIEKHGECVHPVHETPAVEKVNVGGLCNTYSECQDDSSCVLGRCRCISPLLEIAGKCIFQMAPKEVGPGEVCENGEVCIKGSICSADIPVCICPVGTDLEDDICVPVLTTDTNTAPTLKPPTTMPQLPDTLPPTTAALPTTETSTTSSTTTTTTTTTPIPTTSTTTTIPPETKISTIYTMPTLTHTYPNRPLSAGAKFLKVSETCSLNTDCMMGAYCNGNTNPPTCQCLSTHVNVNGKCEKVIYPGQYGCKNDIQCSVSYPGSVCLDRQCNCPLGYRAIEQTCVSETNPFKKTTSIKPCSLTKPSFACYFAKMACPGGKCSSSFDVNKNLFDSNHRLITLSKRQTKIMSVSRSSSWKGHAIDEDNSVSINSFTCLPTQLNCAGDKGLCYEGICYCFDGYFPDYQMKICIKIEERNQGSEGGVYVDVGGECQLYVDRCLGGSVCSAVNQVCECSEGGRVKNGLCHQFPGGSCVKGESCDNGASCEMGICGCPESHIIVNKSCILKIVQINEMCMHGERCMPGLVCRFGRCVRDSNLRMKPIEEFKSIPQFMIVAPGEVCFKDEYCRAGKCIDGVCGCGQDEFLINGKCLKEKDGNVIEETTIDNCDKLECSNGFTCKSNLCECAQGKQIIGEECLWSGDAEETLNKVLDTLKAQETSRVPISGEACSTLCGSGAFCLSGICTCPPLTVVDFLGRCKSSNPVATPSLPIYFKHQSNLAKASNTYHSGIEKELTALPGESCMEVGTICLNYSFCQDGVCYCGPNKINHNNVCVEANKKLPEIVIKKIEPKMLHDYEDETKSEENTNSNYVECDQTSFCPGGMQCLNNKCAFSHRLLSPPGGSCDSEETCTGNSVCRNDYCVCREPNMIVINGLCLTSDILASTKVFETVTTVQTPSSPVYSTIGLKQNIGDRLAETIYQNTFGPTEPSTIANTPTTQLIPVLANTNGGRKAAPGPLDSCVGGSQCLDNFCICPQGTIADTVSGRCETAAEEEEDEEAVTEAVEEPRKGTLKQSAIYSFIPTTTSTNQQLINSLIINNQQKTPILNSISTTKAPNSFKNNLINTDLTELNRLNLINPDSTATNSFNLINTDSTSKIVTSTPLPLPNPQLYIIRRPATAYNSLTTSFLSKHPGQDIRENIPTIVHHHNISVISLNPDNNNNGDQPKGDLYTIPFTQTYRSSSKEDFNKDNGINDKDLPTFATLFGGMALTTSNPFNFNKFKNLNNNGSPSEIIKTEKSLEVPQVKLSSLPSAPSIVNEVVVDECAKQDQSTSYPNESCQDGQACVGGSECGPEKVCTCPSSRPIIRDNVCTSVNSTQLEKIAGPGEECSFEVKCSENAECSQSLCRCNSGFIAISNECMKLPTAQSVSITNNVPSSDLKLQSAGGFGSNSGAKPRIVGAPIRRTKKIKNGGKGAITTTNEAGICPSGNEPTRDDATNKVISCSGMTPNCPPRSYCYVTGVADGIFNCYTDADYAPSEELVGLLNGEGDYSTESKRNLEEEDGAGVPALLRFGKRTVHNFYRFGKRETALMKKDMPGLMRFGKRSNVPGLLRFGRSFDDKKSMPGFGSPMRFGKRGFDEEKSMPLVMRFGKRSDFQYYNLNKKDMPGNLRFGKKSGMSDSLMLGKKSDMPGKSKVR